MQSRRPWQLEEGRKKKSIAAIATVACSDGRAMWMLSRAGSSTHPLVKRFAAPDLEKLSLVIVGKLVWHHSPGSCDHLAVFFFWGVNTDNRNKSTMKPIMNTRAQ